MPGFYRIKSVSQTSSGSFGLRYCFTNGTIKNMMRNKKPVLCTTSSLIKVLTETLWQKVSFSEESNFNYLGARNSDCRFFGDK